MTTRAELFSYLEQIAPLALAEDWDNVGLLLGSDQGPVSRVLTCLTLTPDVAEEALREQVDVIVTHHPILFRPVQKITSANSEGRMILDLVAAGISVYSPHTAYDSAGQGINAQLAASFSLQDVVPIRPLSSEKLSAHPKLQGLGSGRIGRLSQSDTLGELTSVISGILPAGAGIQSVGDPKRVIRKVAVACGSAAEFLRDAERAGADVLVTGEARFHSCLEARTLGVALVIVGHYASERPGIERLAEIVSKFFTDVTAFPSQTESDPLRLA